MNNHLNKNLLNNHRMRGVTLALICLITLSSANALTINLNSAEQIVNSNDNITINYDIILDSAATTNYAIILSGEKEYTVINETSDFSTKTGMIQYNTSELTAGNYTLLLKISSETISLTQTASSKIRVTSELRIRTEIQGLVPISGSEEIINATLKNLGNTKTSISAYFTKTESEISIAPQSFTLEKDEEKTVMINIKKPASDYNTTLVIMASNNEEEARHERIIRIIIPVINITLGEIKTLESENETIINAIIQNNGNINVNANISIRTFTITEGFKNYEETITINAGETINHTTTIPKKTIASYSVKYEGETITKELNAINTIPLDIKLSKDRLILLGILIAIVGVIAYFKWFKNKRP